MWQFIWRYIYIFFLARFARSVFKTLTRGSVGKFPDCSCCVICFQRRKAKLCILVRKTFFYTTIYLFRGSSSNHRKFRAQGMDTNNVRSTLTVTTFIPERVLKLRFQRRKDPPRLNWGCMAIAMVSRIL